MQGQQLLQHGQPPCIPGQPTKMQNMSAAVHGQPALMDEMPAAMMDEPVGMQADFQQVMDEDTYEQPVILANAFEKDSAGDSQWQPEEFKQVVIESPAEEGPTREVARYKEQVLDPLKATWEDNAVPCEEDDGDEGEGEAEGEAEGEESDD